MLLILTLAGTVSIVLMLSSVWKHWKRGKRKEVTLGALFILGVFLGLVPAYFALFGINLDPFIWLGLAAGCMLLIPGAALR